MFRSMSVYDMKPSNWSLSFVDSHGRQIGHEDFVGTKSAARRALLRRLPAAMREEELVYGGFAKWVSWANGR